MMWKQSRSEEGSSAIEFALYMFIFVLMCGFLMDMSFAIIKKSQTERVNNSLMMIFRERIAFYNSVETITQADLTHLKNISDTLLRKEDGSLDGYQLAIRMISFSPRSTKTTQFPVEIFYASPVVSGCDIINNKSRQNRLIAMSAWGLRPNATKDETEFWYPVYEITLCVPGAVSYFNRALGVFNSKLDSLYIRNVALPRK
ncbi:tight adherence pilus pseudopilin TadF [Klebsiella spallanzanii]|uniref:tight adherence pilus pseudopilin TadF n=1 Tax=Klebsiella spallanzanii TaxID=2587528 RepID=UPI0011599C6D|nr:tight adherence pilus pseudopilin TadF [Klebsiella spallanzanii]VUS64777.1 hypothetical protein SB6419_03893 [Klebsiella spallanzanii]